MNGIVIVSLVSLLVVVDVFRLFARRTTLSRTGILIGAIVRAMIPLSAAIGISAVELIRSFQGIAANGSGGMAVVAAGADQLVRTLLTGVIAFVVVLVLALVLVARHRLIDADNSGQSRTMRLRAVMATMVVAGALGSAWMAMYWAEKASVGIVAPMLRGGVFDPTPSPKLAAAPRDYAGYLKMSGREAAMESEHLITSRAIGFGLCVLFVGLSLATPAVFSGLRASGAAWQCIRGSVVALVGVAIWYSVRLGAGADWLRTLVDR